MMGVFLLILFYLTNQVVNKWEARKEKVIPSIDLPMEPNLLVMARVILIK